jgi:hypothetical protein
VEPPGYGVGAWPDKWWRVFDDQGRLLALFSREADARAFVALPALIEAATNLMYAVDSTEYSAECMTEITRMRAALAQADGPKEQP